MIHTCTITRRRAAVLSAALVIGALACREDVGSPTSPELGPTLESVPAVALSFRQISAGLFHNCAVTSDNRAFCWGLNGDGQLGNGTTSGPETCSLDDVPCSTRPVPVSGGIRFRQVSAGGMHSCGVTPDNLAYCWGLNQDGQLGNGTFRNRLMPVRVAGGLRFRGVSAGTAYTCGVTTDNRAFCWGRNGQGRLGDGTSDIDRPSPVPVAGGRFFLQVDPGFDHTCGVTTANRVYCWGLNTFGKLGDGATVFESLTPVAIASGRRFRQVSAGHSHTCAVTTDDRAFCWGNGRSGQIGDGRDFVREEPKAVAGGLLFRHVSAGGGGTCGVATDQRLFCWGGLTGDGTFANRLTPVPVGGGLQFQQVRAGYRHTCGVTTASQVFCWGLNDFGQLGDGTTTDQRAPTPVASTTGIAIRRLP